VEHQVRTPPPPFGVRVDAAGGHVHRVNHEEGPVRQGALRRGPAVAVVADVVGDVERPVGRAADRSSLYATAPIPAAIPPHVGGETPLVAVAARRGGFAAASVVVSQAERSAQRCRGGCFAGRWGVRQFGEVPGQ